MAKRYPDTKPMHSTPEALAARDAGGFLAVLAIAPIIKVGCGALTYVTGTNGGQMPCGALLTRFGKTAPYLCGHCQSN